MQKPIVEIAEGVFGYGDRPVLTIPHLLIRPGEVVALVGRSGAGKSTLLATLNGAMPLLSGTVLVDGEQRHQIWLGSNTSRTLQSFPLLHWLKVKGNLMLAARIRRVKGFEPSGLLKSLGIEHLADRWPNEISGGERARASVALAIVAKPRLLMLDEPLSGLDVIVKQDVAKVLFDFARRGTTAIIFVTHEVYDAVKFSDRVAVVTSTNPGRLSHVLDAAKPGILDGIPALLMNSSQRSGSVPPRDTDLSGVARCAESAIR